MADECPHGGDPNCCPPCQQPAQGRKLPRWRTARTLTARFNGRCRECADPIDVGDVVAQQTSDRGGARYVHQRCDDLPKAPRRAQRPDFELGRYGGRQCTRCGAPATATAEAHTYAGRVGARRQAWLCTRRGCPNARRR